MAQATDVLTLTVAKQALGINTSDGDQDAKLGRYITAISQRLDQACGPIVQRQVTEYLDGGYTTVRTSAAPIFSFTSVTEYFQATPLVLTQETAGVAGTYYAERWPITLPEGPAGLFSGRIRRRQNWGDTNFVSGMGNVVIVAQAGRYASTAAVSGTRFEQAALLLLKFWWSQEILQTAPVGGYDVPSVTWPKGMPNALREMLAHDWVDGLAIA